MNNTNLKVTVYTPESLLFKPKTLIRDMCSDLVAARGLAWRLFLRNIRAQYRQSVLGYLWAFLPPLFTMAVWVYLNSQNIINIDDPGMPYPVFVMTGTVLWQIFVDALNSPLKIMNESRAMLAKINFPREALVMAGLGEVLFNFAVRVILLVGIFVWFEISVPETIFYTVPGIIVLVLLGITFGTIFTPLGMLYQDIGRGLSLIAQIWFFLTPIIYPMPKSGIPAFLASLNPVTPVLVTVREWMTIGASSQLFGFWIVTGASLVLIMFAWLLYRISIPHLIARMSA